MLKDRLHDIVMQINGSVGQYRSFTVRFQYECLMPLTADKAKFVPKCFFPQYQRVRGIKPKRWDKFGAPFETATLTASLRKR